MWEARAILSESKNCCNTLTDATLLYEKKQKHISLLRNARDRAGRFLLLFCRLLESFDLLSAYSSTHG